MNVEKPALHRLGVAKLTADGLRCGLFARLFSWRCRVQKTRLHPREFGDSLIVSILYTITLTLSSPNLGAFTAASSATIAQPIPSPPPGPS